MSGSAEGVVGDLDPYSDYTGQVPTGKGEGGGVVANAGAARRRRDRGNGVCRSVVALKGTAGGSARVADEAESGVIRGGARQRRA